MCVWESPKSEEVVFLLWLFMNFSFIFVVVRKPYHCYVSTSPTGATLSSHKAAVVWGTGPGGRTHREREGSRLWGPSSPLTKSEPDSYPSDSAVWTLGHSVLVLTEFTSGLRSLKSRTALAARSASASVCSKCPHLSSPTKTPRPSSQRECVVPRTAMGGLEEGSQPLERHTVLTTMDSSSLGPNYAFIPKARVSPRGSRLIPDEHLRVWLPVGLHSPTYALASHCSCPVYGWPLFTGPGDTSLQYVSPWSRYRS